EARLGRRTPTAQAHAAGVGRLSAVADVGDDVLLLVRGQLPVGELGHVLRADDHRGPDQLRVDIVQVGCVLARGQGAALAGEVVAGRAVLAEQVAADRGIRRSEAVAVAAATGADQVLTLDELL